MNSRKRWNGAGSITAYGRIAAWRQLLDRCQRKPTRKRVHALRVVTLRLQAQLETELAELPRAARPAKAILAFSRQAEKLRKALGPVRELDVWIGKLRGLRARLAEPGVYVPRSTRACVRQLEQFESQLKQSRRPLEKKLIAAIEKRIDNLSVRADVIGADLAGHATSNGLNAASTIRTRFAEIAKSFPAFDQENLHEFRKRIKLIRYIAELHQGDAASAQIAAQMKKLQSAIGEWHDWQALARRVRRGCSRRNDAAELLEAIAAESLEAALTTSRSITSRLLAEDAPAPHPAPVRKPPQRADHDQSEAAAKKIA